MKINPKNLSRNMLYAYIVALPYLAIVYPIIADAIFILFALSTMLNILKKGIRRSFFSKSGVFIIGLLCLAVITSFLAENKSAAFGGSWTLIQLLIFDFMLMAAIDSEEIIENCLKAFVIGTYTMMLFVFSKTGIHILSVLPTWRFGQGDAAINVNSIGAAAGWSVVILFLFYKREPKKAYLAFMLAPMLFVFASASRASLLIVLFGVTLYFLLSGQKGSTVRLAIAGFLIVMAYGLVESMNLFPEFMSRFDQLLKVKDGIDATDGSTKARYMIVLYGLEMMKQKLILGYGMGQFAFSFQDELLAPHNAFIQIGYAFGLIGLIWWYGNIASSSIRIAKHSRSQVFRWIVVLNVALVCMGISAHSLTDKTAHLFLIMLFNSDVLAKQQCNNSEMFHGEIHE